MSSLTKPPHGVSITSGQPYDVSRVSKDAIMQVFERIGGIDRLTEVADKDPKWYYQHMFTKTIQPEKVVAVSEKSIAEMLAELDAQMVQVTPNNVDTHQPQVLDMQTEANQAEYAEDEES